MAPSRPAAHVPSDEEQPVEPSNFMLLQRIDAHHAAMLGRVQRVEDRMEAHGSILEGVKATMDAQLGVLRELNDRDAARDDRDRARADRIEQAAAEAATRRDAWAQRIWQDTLAPFLRLAAAVLAGGLAAGGAWRMLPGGVAVGPAAVPPPTTAPTIPGGPTLPASSPPATTPD